MEKLNSETCVCNPRFGEGEMGGPLGIAGQIQSIHGKAEFSDMCL